ncbi:MAG: GYF domain-containing protein [Limisphaerales bacterium]
MYRIIGGDRHEYGPATAEEVRQWIAEGRLSGQSLVQVQGSGEWKPLSAYPEFAEALGAQSHYGSGASSDPKAWLAEVLARPAEVRAGDCLARSWDLVRNNLGLLLGATCLIWLAETLCQGFKLGIMAALVLRGPLYGGLSMVYLNRLRGRPASIGDAFAGFRRGFAQLLLAGFISYLLAWLGACCCLIVPGIYLFVAWLFSVPLVADRDLEFWSAMELSRRTVTRVWFQVFVLFVLAFLPALLVFGFLQAKVMLATMPVVQSVLSPGTAPDFTRMMELFTQAQQAAKIAPALVVAAKLVLLFNLPFGLGALLAAYENLFGTRPPSSP